MIGARRQLALQMQTASSVPWPVIIVLIEDIAQYLLTKCGITVSPGAEIQRLANRWPTWVAYRYRVLAEGSGMTFDQIDKLQPSVMATAQRTDVAVLDAALKG